MKGNGGNGHNRLVAAAIRFQPDSRLVGLVREGHDLAFEEIVRRYRPALVSFAAAIVPPDHAEDVVQEALTKAHRALGSGDTEINLRPWLYTIVRNRALNALRDEPAHDHLDENFDGVPQPPQVAARREELVALIAGLKGLPAPQREAIVKRELEGRSHEEIASSLGVSAGAVRGLIYRARATLRDCAGMLIPMPLLRALLSSGAASDATGAAAAGLTAGGGGIALKAGATLGVAVIAVGSGFAIQHHGSRPDAASTLAERGGANSHASGDGAASAVGDDRGSVAGELRSGDGSSSGPGPGGSGSHGSSGPSDGRSSGPGSGSSGEGSGSSGPGGGGSSGSGDDGGGSGSTTSDDGGGSGGSGGGGGGSGTSGSGGGTSGSSDDGGSSGSGDGSGSGGSGGGDLTTTATTTTTTTIDGGGSSGPD